MTEQRNIPLNENENQCIGIGELKKQIEALGDEEFMMPIELGGNTDAK